MKRNHTGEQELRGYGVCLRPLRHEDIEMVRNWRNDPKVFRFMHYRDYITPEMQEAWFQSIDNEHYAFFIIHIEDQPVGLTDLKHIDFNSRTAEGGIFFYDDTCQNGLYPYATIALRNGYAFNTLELNALYAYILNNNLRAVRFNQSLGYVPTDQLIAGNKRLYTLTKDAFWHHFKRFKPLLDAQLGYWSESW